MIPHVTSHRTSSLLLLLSLLALFGCGTGDGGPGGSKARARERAIASARIMRATYAIVGLGKPIIRSAEPRAGLAALIAAGAHPGRDVVKGLDADTKLYYVRTTNSDGSGRADFFTDAAYSRSAGGLTWSQPQWSGSPNTYPEVVHATFQMTAGELAGDSGTIDLTKQDGTGSNLTLHIVLTDAKNESSKSDFKIVNGVIKGTSTVTLSDDTTCNETDSMDAAGIILSLVNYSDGSQEDLTLTPDGSGTETLDNSNGSQEATGSFDSSGDDTIDYQDGSSETVNVDTTNS